MARKFSGFGGRPAAEQDSEYFTITTPDVELRVSLGAGQEHGSPARASLPAQPTQARASLPPRVSQPLPARSSQFNPPARPSQFNPPARPSQFSRVSQSPAQPFDLSDKVRQLFGESALPESEPRSARGSAAEAPGARASAAALGQKLAHEQLYASGLEAENRSLKAEYEEYLRRLQEENGQLRLAESRLVQATQERQQLQEHMESLLESTARRSSSEVASTAQHFREKMRDLKQEIKALEARVQLQQQRTQHLHEQLRENKLAAAAEVQTLNGALSSLKERYKEVREENAALRANAARGELDANVAVLLDAKECTIEALQHRLRLLEAENAEKAAQADCRRCLSKDHLIDDMSTLLTRDDFGPAAGPSLSVEQTTVYADAPEYRAYESPLMVERVSLPAYAELTPQPVSAQRTALGGYSSRSLAAASRERFVESAYAPGPATYVTERVYEAAPPAPRAYLAEHPRHSYLAEHPRHSYLTEHVYEPEVVLKPAGVRAVYAPSRSLAPLREATHVYRAAPRAPTTVSMVHRESDRFGNVITDESLVFID